MARVFDRLDVWYDTLPRCGAENMAVDQLLMEQVGQQPLLRVYHWSEPTVSFGYFLPVADAMRAFPGEDLTYIRRWTGGGVVDHREDITYTLAIPRIHSLATSRGAESYREIHTALAATLQQLGQDVILTHANMGDGAAACFANPVAFDLVGKSGEKIAGAGQRRTKYGLLHQGSVIADVSARNLLEGLQGHLADEAMPYDPDNALLEQSRQLAVDRYGTEVWLNKK